ncbi:hypothetical protein NCAST_34_02330 [Nocardia asteroides NBRC 15531]|uniref:Uncharacterized protein n=1 Tax=Nocardia asteroides NBRC 15531 TaxID=1110697 RepID=U5EL97_NOCAS|nr:hypothetical protein NCAST_34_02330 [Nocardia asteroides NBRC 15531]
MSGWVFFTLIRDPWRVVLLFCTASHTARVTRGSWVGSGDHTHFSGGTSAPPFLLARRFHTM